VLGIAVALMLNAFRDSIVFFNSPSDVVENHVGRARASGSAAWSKTAALFVAIIFPSA